MANRSPAADESIGQAPGALATVQAFVNTKDIELATDELTSPASLTAWLRSAGLLGEHEAPGSVAGQPDVDLAVGLREALRGVLRAHAGHGSAPEPAADLGRIAASLRVRLQVDPAGQIRPAAAGADGVRSGLARLLLIAAEAGPAGTWGRLKACSADDCQWAFYDRSPTRNGCWCSMQICGARAKSRAYRRRARPTASRSARTAGPGA